MKARGNPCGRPGQAQGLPLEFVHFSRGASVDKSAIRKLKIGTLKISLSYR